MNTHAQSAPSYLEYNAQRVRLPTYQTRVKTYRSEWTANKSLAAPRRK